LAKQPDLEGVPANVRRLLGECLQKNPKLRLRDIGDAKRLLAEEGPPAAAPSRSRLAWIAAAGALAIALAWLSFVHFREVPSERLRARFQIAPSEKFRLADFKLSPDGRFLAFIPGEGSGRGSLWIRALDSLESRVLRESHQTLRDKFLLGAIARPMGAVIDLYARRKDGMEVPVEVGLDPIEAEEGSCVLASIVDVSERKLAEERLRESEERFRATFYQAAVGIAQTTTDGRWLLLNDRLCEILGYSRDELLGKTFVDITHPDDREASLADIRKLLTGEIPYSSLEKRYIGKDGRTV